MRKVTVVGIAVAVVMAALNNAMDVFTILALPCAMVLLLIWSYLDFLVSWAEENGVKIFGLRWRLP